MKLLLTSAAIAAMTFAPVAAHAQFGGLFGGSAGNTLLGAGAGAGIGALIAGQGNNVEGALLGAALGGVAGNAFLPRSQGGFDGPSNGSFPVQGGFPVQSRYPVQSGFVGSACCGAPVAPQIRYVQPAPVVQPVYVNRTVYVQRPAPAPVVRRVVVPAPAPVVIQAPQLAACPSNTTPQADGTCLDRNVTHYANPVQGRSSSSRTEPCPSGTSKQSDGTCLSPMVTHIDRTAEYIAPAPVQQQVWVQQPVQAIAPVQQDVFCYNGSSKQYDDCGHNLANPKGKGGFLNWLK